eukprot:GHVR01171145.1.p1 GENE.GHVR01171145.1~~GHVR01171145.1.p1  ORF type:complete len:413 (+),score=86.19 GHVR01171145.1:104-1342(+)
MIKGKLEEVVESCVYQDHHFHEGKDTHEGKETHSKGTHLYMAEQAHLEKIETVAISISMLMCFLLGGASIVFFILSHSYIVLLDGAFNLIYGFTCIIGMFVARTITRPDDTRYPFGRHWLEPLSIFLKGFILTILDLFALVESILTLFNGGRNIEAGVALYYGIMSTVGCVLCALLLFILSKKCNSSLIRADIVNWVLNAIVSSAVLVGFIIAIFLKNSGNSDGIRWIDPSLVIGVILFTIYFPIKMLLRSMCRLINVGNDQVRKKVHDIAVLEVDKVFKEDDVLDVFTRAIKPSRLVLANTYVIVKQHVMISAQSLEEVRVNVTRQVMCDKDVGMCVFDLIISTSLDSVGECTCESLQLRERKTSKCIVHSYHKAYNTQDTRVSAYPPPPAALGSPIGDIQKINVENNYDV